MILVFFFNTKLIILLLYLGFGTCKSDPRYVCSQPLWLQLGGTVALAGRTCSSVNAYIEESKINTCLHVRVFILQKKSLDFVALLKKSG